jgi:hypothetical protein
MRRTLKTSGGTIITLKSPVTEYEGYLVSVIGQPCVM